MRKYWPLHVLALIFIAPALAAIYILYFEGTVLLPTKQNGILIQPAQKISHPLAIRHKWNVLYANTADQQSFKNLYVALGKDQERVMLAQSDWQEGAAIIDPNGMYILHYPNPINMSGLLKDLRRLLKYSHAR